ncbi:hypothetical protein DND47_20855 [Pseudomonas syringae pv. syringae]|nr:hypothetical protein DND47_20855 [Pseudomonas syringae pv. syringae]
MLLPTPGQSWQHRAFFAHAHVLQGIVLAFLRPRVCKNVTSEGKTRQKQAKKRSLGVLNEHFSPVFNAVLPSAVVFTQPGPSAARI